MATRLAQRAMESPAVARIYESRLWRRNPLVEAATGLKFEQELALIEGAAPLAEASRVLDLACGSGIYARPLAHRGGQAHVVGFDLSRAMLVQARRRARAEGLRNLSLVRGDAQRLPFRANEFEWVNCCGALHLFLDLGQALAEVHRVLAPGGRFTLAAIRAGEGALDRVARTVRKRFLGVASFRVPELERHLRQAGLRNFELLHEHGLWLLASAAKRPEAG